MPPLNSGNSTRRDEPAYTTPSRGWFFGLSGPVRLIAVAVFFLVAVALFFAEENWRGARAWAACRRALEAQGVELDWRKLTPPPVPDDQNFAMTPFLAPLFDFNPLPLQPGQTRWRDEAGRDRATKFAADILQGANLRPSVELDGRLLEFSRALKNPAVSTNLSRAEAAAVVLSAMREFEPVLDEIRAASRKPFARFNIEYNAHDPMGILLPHLAALRHICNVLQARACAELALSQTGAAFQDLELMLYLADSIQNEPFLISFLVRSQLLKSAEQVVWEGLAQKRWADSQLHALQERFSRFNLARDLETKMLAERASFGGTAFTLVRQRKDVLRSWIGSGQAGELSYLLGGPTGWFDFEQVSYQRLCETRVRTGFDPTAGIFYPEKVEENQRALKMEFIHYIRNHTAFSKLVLAHLGTLLRKTAFHQTLLAETITVCALERSRLANGHYPDTLESLQPGLLAAIPIDPCNGKPLAYQLAGNSFTLNGVGWNRTDEPEAEGQTSLPVGNEPKNGVWAWPQYPLVN